MSSYAIQAVSDPQNVIQAHQKRGFEVVTASISWKGAQDLARALGMPIDKDHLMVVSTLARRAHQATQAQEGAFRAHTLVVLPASDRERIETLEATNWGRLQQVAGEGESEVVFLFAGS